MRQRGWLRFTGFLTFAVILLTLGIMIGQSLRESRGAFDDERTQKPDDKPPVDKTGNGPVAYVGARIHTASGPVIPRGTLLVQGGKILDVGPQDKVDLPGTARVVDMTGKVIIPGLVDTHSHIGIFGRPNVGANSDGNEMTGPVQPGLRALDAIHPEDPGIRMALAGGVTTANIMPGSGNAIGGQTLYVKLRGSLVEMMRLIADFVLGGIKFANGENVKGAYGGKNQAPGTRTPRKRKTPRTLRPSI